VLVLVALAVGEVLVLAAVAVLLVDMRYTEPSLEPTLLFSVSLLLVVVL
jgi:hypothetical protein